MRIELTENDQNGQVVILTDGDATALAGVGLVKVQPDGPDRWRLVPLRNRVGAVRVGELDLVVRPKASFMSLIFMLGYARDPGFRTREIEGLSEDDLWPAVGETFARLAERALSRGVLQGYVTRDESISLLRGRLRAADQVVRRPGALLPLEVTYDEYESDIAENQILRAGLRRMLLVPRLPSGLRARLGHLAGRLDGVSLLLSGAPLPVWRPSRANVHYQPALQLAELVLRTVGLSTSAGGVPVAAFAIDMAAAFEDFVVTALRETFAVLSPRGRTEGQYPAWMDEGARVRIKPDVVHLVGGRAQMVLDAKYKIGYRGGGYPTADVYQLHAYCTALGLTRGYLLYAGSRVEGAVPTEHRVLNTEIDVVQWPLDVRVAPAELLGQVEALATHALTAGSTRGIR